jgi:hypothetical protein
MVSVSDPVLDGRLDWSGTLAALTTRWPPATTHLGCLAQTSDQGMAYNNGSAWVPIANTVTSPTFANITLTGLFNESAADNLTAHAGGGQASALQLAAELNRITTVANAGDSVKLPPSAPGLTIVVLNHGANAIQVFGAGTDTIDDGPTATGVSQMSNSVVIYACATAGAWYTEGLATGYIPGTSLQTFSSIDGLVAHPGGGQASATALLAMMNRIATVGTAGDSVALPASGKGMDITVTNAASNSLNIYPSAGGTGTEAINALGANTAFALGANKSVQLICYTPGLWHSVPLVP